jgi:hypothetical protein
MVKEFEDSVLWLDIREYIYARLALNYKDLIQLETQDREMSLLKGSTSELTQLLRLPEVLLEAIDRRETEEKVRNAKKAKQQAAESSGG